ncbi:MAG: transglutaminase-like cysteine peptidase [Geminicoccaceae bacterium]
MNTALKVAIVATAIFASSSAAAGPLSLFNTMEHRTESLEAIPQWQRALAKIQREQRGYQACSGAARTCNSPEVRLWQTMVGQQQGKPQIDQLDIVNRFINKWRYRADDQNYGRSDYWASPAEFFSRSGDCEDYAIAKYVTLRQLGFSADQLRLVVVKDTKRDLAHAVLAAYVDGDIYILDNLNNRVKPQATITKYSPYYSINEKARWAHAVQPASTEVAAVTKMDPPAQGPVSAKSLFPKR